MSPERQEREDKHFNLLSVVDDRRRAVRDMILGDRRDQAIVNEWSKSILTANRSQLGPVDSPRRFSEFAGVLIGEVATLNKDLSHEPRSGILGLLGVRKTIDEPVMIAVPGLNQMGRATADWLIAHDKSDEPWHDYGTRALDLNHELSTELWGLRAQALADKIFYAAVFVPDQFEPN